MSSGDLAPGETIKYILQISLQNRIKDSQRCNIVCIAVHLNMTHCEMVIKHTCLSLKTEYNTKFVGSLGPCGMENAIE